MKGLIVSIFLSTNIALALDSFVKSVFSKAQKETYFEVKDDISKNPKTLKFLRSIMAVMI